jgi:hypothetical protein
MTAPVTEPVYCIDASALIELQRFRREIFKSVWLRIEELVDDGRLIAPIQVKTELIDKGNDAIEQWVKQHPQMFIEIDEAQGAFITRMYRDYPHLATQAANRVNALRADPFIVALAAIRRCRVVTLEGKKTWASQTSASVTASSPTRSTT